MSIQSEINRINNSVSDQASLIQQIKTELSNKTSGSSGSLVSKGMAIKTGTTTSRIINTGLSDIEQFFIYKESQTTTGLIHLHYTKAATSRMYASAWSTNTWGSKTITNESGGVTVDGGDITISATSAAQGGLSSNVTYKWIAIGIE